jgi:hypothetical protein
VVNAGSVVYVGARRIGRHESTQSMRCWESLPFAVSRAGVTCWEGGSGKGEGEGELRRAVATCHAWVVRTVSGLACRGGVG